MGKGAMPKTGQTAISANLREVRAKIAAAAREAGRDAQAVTLVAVSKTHPAAAVETALAAGQTVFGENRVQEARAKFPALKAAHPDLRLHLIGPLQTNKANDALEIFDVIETLERPKPAGALAREAERPGRAPACYLQVNPGEAPTQEGVEAGQGGAFGPA